VLAVGLVGWVLAQADHVLPRFSFKLFFWMMLRIQEVMSVRVHMDSGSFVPLKIRHPSI
jgi:hypothetical protein